MIMMLQKLRTCILLSFFGIGMASLGAYYVWGVDNAILLDKDHILYLSPKAYHDLEPVIQEIGLYPAGQTLLASVKTPLVIHISNSDFMPAYLRPMYRRSWNTIFLAEYSEDNDWQFTIETKKGRRHVLMDRILAHELGHAAGERDDGPDCMSNIKRWENPVMYPLDGMKRISYEGCEPEEHDPLSASDRAQQLIKEGKL